VLIVLVDPSMWACFVYGRFVNAVICRPCGVASRSIIPLDDVEHGGLFISYVISIFKGLGLLEVEDNLVIEEWVEYKTA
jgi:hypothetical protein